MKPNEMLASVSKELDGLSWVQGARGLQEKLSAGSSGSSSSGEAIIIINACKCIHVLKNWCFVSRSA